jgi:hypothetical protein
LYQTTWRNNPEDSRLLPVVRHDHVLLGFGAVQSSVDANVLEKRGAKTQKNTIIILTAVKTSNIA